MAETEYSELAGNEPLLKAVEYLRMLPEWKAKPGKLRTGYIEFAEVLSRHLINIYCTLEGKPLSEKIELSNTLNPLAQERAAEFSRRNEESSLRDHFDQLNTWHLDLAIVEKGMGRLIRDLGDHDEDLGAIGHVLTGKLHDLVEHCPFPAV